MGTFARQIQTDPLLIDICQSALSIDVSDVAMDVLELCDNADELRAMLGFSSSSNQLNCSLDTASIVTQLTSCTPLEYSIRYMTPADVLQTLANSADTSCGAPIAFAAWRGYDDLLKPLLDAGADINAIDEGGRSALYWACYYARSDTLGTLIEHAGDRINWHARTRDGRSRNALEVAKASIYWHERPHSWPDKMFVILRDHGLGDGDEDDGPLMMPGGFD